MSEARVILPGSHRQPAHGAEVIGPANPADRAHVTVYVRGKDKPLPITQPGHYISNEEYAAAYGASANDFQAVIEFAKQYNLTPAKENAATRSIELHGTVGDLSRAFGVTLQTAKIDAGIHRVREGGISVPENLLPIITAIVGLDDRPQAKPHARKFEPQSLNEALAVQTFTPIAIGQMYNFPPNLDGTGQIIAVIELGGGFLQSDMDSYFQGLGVAKPTITVVPVNGGSNVMTPGPTPTNSEIEVAMDIQIIGALAPGAKQLVYFTPSASDQNFLAAVNAAIVATPQPAVISISWGGPENKHTTQFMQQFETALAHAAQLGIPVTVASGDDGSFDDKATLQVDYPSSCPHALSCGGTTITASGGKLTDEVVWKTTTGGSGGGVSQVFSKPTYQSTVTIPPIPGGGSTGGRGVPDVAGDADSQTGYAIKVKNTNFSGGGTSAVAPLWAALIARFAQSTGKPVGFLNPLLYQTKVSGACFRDVTKGTNDSGNSGGPYSAGKGWDACTGFGSPDGVALLKALKAGTGTGTGTTGTTGTGHVSFGSTTPPQAPPPFEYPILPPPVPAPAPLPPTLPSLPGLGDLLSGGSNSVALVGIVGLAAVVGLVAATGIVATVAIAKDKQ